MPPKIRNVRGRVVFMSSVVGLFHHTGTGTYNASKYAIESLADALRMELRPWRIPVSLMSRTDPYRMWADSRSTTTTIYQDNSVTSIAGIRRTSLGVGS